jgi:hypothetical protein
MLLLLLLLVPPEGFSTAERKLLKILLKLNPEASWTFWASEYWLSQFEFHKDAIASPERSVESEEIDISF